MNNSRVDQLLLVGRDVGQKIQADGGSQDQMTRILLSSRGLSAFHRKSATVI